jgi:hypothetical protein
MENINVWAVTEEDKSQPTVRDTWVAVSDSRKDSLEKALDLGADEETLTALRDAIRLSRRPTIVLPAHRFESLSRGRGWARKGRGSDVSWGDREDGGYRVGPGRWAVGATDGFSRKASVDWQVKNVQIGQETWTIAS